MSIVWDKSGSRTYETGLDRGVLYLPDSSGIPWNGLTSIEQNFDKDVSATYFDGRKISDLVELGDYSAKMKALTYPDEFAEIDGTASLMNGIFLEDQPPQTFGLCYRTLIGNDTVGNNAGYKLHIIYNLTAVPSDKEHQTITDDPSLVEFEWDISAVPEDILGFRPTAHIVIDSRTVNPQLLVELEKMLYGVVDEGARLPPMNDLINYIYTWMRIRIIDNGDGTWTADYSVDSDVDFGPDPDQFTIYNANATYLNPETYTISDSG